MTCSAGGPRVLEATDAEMCGLYYLSPKDVNSEAIDLSDRVRMWMRISMMLVSRPERDEDYAKSCRYPLGRSDS